MHLSREIDKFEIIFKKIIRAVQKVPLPFCNGIVRVDKVWEGHEYCLHVPFEIVT